MIRKAHHYPHTPSAPAIRTPLSACGCWRTTSATLRTCASARQCAREREGQPRAACLIAAVVAADGCRGSNQLPDAWL